MHVFNVYFRTNKKRQNCSNNSNLIDREQVMKVERHIGIFWRVQKLDWKKEEKRHEGRERYFVNAWNERNQEKEGKEERKWPSNGKRVSGVYKVRGVSSEVFVFSRVSVY